MTAPTDPAPALSERRPLSRGLVAGVTSLVVLAGLGGAAVGASIDTDDRSSTMMGDRRALAGDAGEERFLADMLEHHGEAVAAARQLQRSDRAPMRALGRRIVTGQTAQVQQMRTWSSRWYGDAAPESDYRPMMRDLDGLDGDRLDEAFLDDMSQHHMMAVMMARQLLVGGALEHEELGDLARTIVREQSAEMRQMHRWSQAWFGRAWYDGGMMSDGPMTGGSDG